MTVYYSWMFKSSQLILEIFQIPCVLCKVSGLGRVLGGKKDQEKHSKILLRDAMDSERTLLREIIICDSCCHLLICLRYLPR